MRVFIVLFALIWVGGFSAALYWLHPAGFLEMSPGDWGEFLSGAFGPPSFIAVVATLIQQGTDLKRQQLQLDEQLRAMERQIGAQSDLAATAKAQSETMLGQARAATQHAETAKQQTELAIERLQIERMTNRASGLAMLIVRYSDRLMMRPTGRDQTYPLVGEKAELRQDFGLGPEAVLETMRQRLRAHTDQLKKPTAARLVLETSHKNSLESLLNNLI